MAERQQYERAVKACRQWIDPLRFPGILSVGVGHKHRGGVFVEPRTLCIVFGVEKKKLPNDVPADQLIPAEIEFEGVRLVTDVVQVGKIRALALTSRQRPCPGGYSCGHERVTAGTLGVWVHREADPQGWYILSNNHVLAASNEGSIGSPILQPGKADGGTLVDRIATLTEFVPIRFDEGEKKKQAAAAFWRAWKWVPNRVARAVGCPYRLKLERLPTAAAQQAANLIDAAVAKAVAPEVVEPEIHLVGAPAGFGELDLGARVQKTGRTTTHTQGAVEQIGATVKVDYGEGRTATFEDQVIIRGDGGDFSAPGDSGSAVEDEEKRVNGLLFAGGEGITVVSRIANVVSLLGIRL